MRANNNVWVGWRILIWSLVVTLTLMSCYAVVFFSHFGFIPFPMDEFGKDLSSFPTRQPLVDFLINDTTNENSFTKDYNCKNYATDLKRNARNLGYRIRIYPVIGERLVEYEALLERYFNVTGSGPGPGHVVCKAYIVDEDLWVTIEPQGDLILNCTIGGR